MMQKVSMEEAGIEPATCRMQIDYSLSYTPFSTLISYQNSDLTYKNERAFTVPAKIFLESFLARIASSTVFKQMEDGNKNDYDLETQLSTTTTMIRSC